MTGGEVKTLLPRTSFMDEYEGINVSKYKKETEIVISIEDLECLA